MRHRRIQTLVELAGGALDGARQEELGVTLEECSHRSVSLTSVQLHRQGTSTWQVCAQE